VYFQIGLLVLIGLGAKNAVLRVSAAVEFRAEGKSIMEATILAGEQRLRPIIMTSLAFAIGRLPLALAVGAGANARHSIGKRHHRRHARRDHARDAVRAAALLSLRPAEGARGSASRKTAEVAPRCAATGGATGAAPRPEGD
jgi:hypothetical protein